MALPTTFFGWVGFIISEYSELLIGGLLSTLEIALLGTVIGFLIGLLVAILRTIPIEEGDSTVKKTLLRILRGILNIYIEVFRGTPMMVQAMVIYYGSLQVLGIDMSPGFAGILIVSINTGAYMAEIIRGGIISIDAGQKEAAYSIGMTHWQSMVHVILPQAIRNILPSVGNELIVNIKDSSVLNVIGVSELYFMAKSAAGTYLKYFETYFIIAVIYLILTYATSRLLALIERRMDGPANYVIHGSQSSSKAAIVVKGGE
jgi:putative lysine transport system permease protein